jgi:hypothetical protein
MNIGSENGIKIEFPTEYDGNWNTIPVPAQLTLTIGANVYVSTSVSLATGRLFANITITRLESFSSAIIKFVFRNPAT